MADDIVSRVSNLKITADEDTMVEFLENPNSETDDFELTLVGKMLTVRTYNFDPMKKTLNQIWAISRGALFRSIENGLFVVRFASKRDKDKVMAGRPWTFDQNLVMLQEIEDDIQPSEIVLKRCPFWVRLYNLPMRSRSESHIRMIGGSIGQVLEIDMDDIGWDKSARLRILLDVTKPLKRVQRIAVKSGGSVLVEIKYERLPTFCYLCGVIGHIERDCLSNVAEDKEVEKQWGSWIRASPRKGRLKIEEEAKEFLKGARSLTFEKARPEMQERCTSLNDGGMAAARRNCREGDAVWVRAAPAVGEGGQKETPCTQELHGLGENILSPPLFVAGNGGTATKFKKVKVKQKVKKHELIVPGDPLNLLIHDNGVGEKRKVLDVMFIDGVEEQCDLGAKKLKINDPIYSGSDVNIVEAEVTKEIVEKTKDRLGFSSSVGISSIGRSGGLCLFWKDEKVSLTLVSFSHNHMCGDVVDNRGLQWRFVGIYGWPEEENKHKTWNLIRSLCDEYEGPIMFGGDFNEILSYNEKEGGANRERRSMVGFRNALDECRLGELRFTGQWYTWERGNSPETRIRERLDRVVVNEEWRNIYPGAHVEHLVRYSSDHAAILMKSAMREGPRKPSGRGFKFETCWLLDEGCEEVVRGAWNATDGAVIQDRLREVARSLQGWSKVGFGDLKKKIEKVEKRLHEAQQEPISAASCAKCAEIELELDNLHAKNEAYWYLRSRVAEVKDGDRNTSYFHHKASQRKQRNYIQGFVVVREVLKFVSPSVTQEFNDFLLKPYTKEEIYSALSQMHPCKAPGPDGMHAIFYQRFCTLLAMSIGEPECLCSRENDFRQFPYCSGNFSLYEKEKNSRKGLMAVKLDMSKAYDRVEWGFLENFC
ncbi:uncharacterized protein LOC130589924 [Beta vulgaris subsp. vulgaris]|uniref:uncharacterized protein LOC130589924 n=1 Tax=Beta vulgaris subsp. vulgaris TaxID=3555 RepID=UPI002549B995|nr:uncharacterized protein LOC130589924 [Beta vulgaris subsp. vulgaris]